MVFYETFIISPTGTLQQQQYHHPVCPLSEAWKNKEALLHVWPADFPLV